MYMACDGDVSLFSALRRLSYDDLLYGLDRKISMYNKSHS